MYTELWDKKTIIELLKFERDESGVFKAISENDISRIRELLDTLSVDTETLWGATLLHIAMILGNKDVISFLVNKGADTTRPMPSDLLKLLDFNDRELLQKLFDSGLDYLLHNSTRYYENAKPAAFCFRYYMMQNKTYREHHGYDPAENPRSLKEKDFKEAKEIASIVAKKPYDQEQYEKDTSQNTSFEFFKNPQNYLEPVSREHPMFREGYIAIKYARLTGLMGRTNVPADREKASKKNSEYLYFFDDRYKGAKYQKNSSNQWTRSFEFSSDEKTGGYCFLTSPRATGLSVEQYKNICQANDILEYCTEAHEKRKGNCGILAALAFEKIWQSSKEAESIYYAYTTDFSHVVCIVIPKDNRGFWIIDPWLADGVVLHSSQIKEYKEKLIEFYKNTDTNEFTINSLVEKLIQNDQIFTFCYSVDATQKTFPSYYRDAMHFKVPHDMRPPEQSVREQFGKSMRVIYEKYKSSKLKKDNNTKPPKVSKSTPPKKI